MNKNKLLVKALSGTLCGAMLLTNITPVYALTTNEQSVSNVEDTRQTEVLYKKNASYFVTIPKNITLDSNKESSYSVKVDGDIASNQEVYVSPIDAISSKDGFNFYMKDQSTKHPKADVVADVAQNKFYWDYKDAADAYTETNNSISAHELSSGEWKGTFDFEINMHRISNEKGLTLSTDGDVTMGLDDTLQVNAYLDGTPVTDEVSWSSSNSSISVDKGLLKTSASAEVGDSSTITVVADTKEQLASVEKALSNVGIVTAHADDSLTASFKVTIVDIELSSYDLYIKPGESATLNATILPLGTEGTVNWTRTAVSGLNLKKNGNSVEIFIARDMEVGKTYQVVASFGDFSKVCTIHIGESAHKHTYTSRVTKEPTCTEAGETTFTCVDGDDSYTQVIQPLGHNFSSEYTVDKEPTHIEAGSKSQHCSRCDAKQNVTSIPATGHKYNSGIVTKKPTCTEKGVKTFTCVDGDYSYTEEIPATGHKYGEATYTWSSDKSTCTAKRVCANDASHVETETVNATSAITKKATCTTTGTKTYTATFKNGAFAKQTTTSPIPATGHKYGTPTYTWSADGKTCTAKRVCANNASHIETENATITNKVKVNANCTTKGTTTYTATFKNSAFTTQTKDVQDINALGHKYASTYTIDKEATCTGAGSKSQHCSRCDAKQNVTSIPATGHKYVNGVCTICGEKNYGADITLTKSNLSSYGISYSGDVVIPGEVRDKKGVLHKITAIDKDAFYNCPYLTSITIPESVTSINAEGFGNCPNLSSIIVDTNNKVYDSRNGCNAIIEKSTNTLIVGCKNTIIPNSVTGIGYKAFYGCSNLTSITIPNSVTSIGLSAFYECTSLTSITIPNSVTNIENSAFNSCYKLTSIKLPNKITSIGIGVFAGCASLTSITIPNSVTSIGNNAFSGCSSLASITIPSSVTSIGNGAFRGCKGLTSITIPKSVTSISNNMFDTCTMLTSITIPESITSIGSYAFHNCWSLNEFNYKGTSYTRATKNDLINALKSNGVSVDTNAFNGL